MVTTEPDVPPAGVDPWQPRPSRVVSRTKETVQTVTIGLVPRADEQLGARPGQFNMLSVWGVGEIAVSVSGIDRDRRVLYHTVRAVGAVSAALTRARPGDTIGVRGPFGTSWEAADAAGGDVVVVAGGVGLAPLRLAILDTMARIPPGRLFVLVGARSPGDLLFARELDRWSRRAGVEVAVTVDRAGPDWSGHVGLVTELVRRAGFDGTNALALVCGPEPMMRFTTSALVDRGTAPGRIRLSLERNMKCGLGLCGHCQLGPLLLCRDGAVVAADRVGSLLGVREL